MILYPPHIPDRKLHRYWLKIVLDHYIAFDFERNVYPLVTQIYWMLRNADHHYQNKYDYFNGAEAYYVPHKTKKIYVCGQPCHDRPTYLVIDDLGDGFCGDFYVRQIWPKTKLDCIGGVKNPTLSLYRKHDFNLSHTESKGVFYGDCRDDGHVLSYKRFNFLGRDHGKCDHTIWDLNAPLHWFFECNSLHTQLIEEYPDELE